MDIGELLEAIYRLGIRDERVAWELAQLAIHESGGDDYPKS